jgi:hypothetical protein
VSIGVRLAHERTPCSKSKANIMPTGATPAESASVNPSPANALHSNSKRSRKSQRTQNHRRGSNYCRNPPRLVPRPRLQPEQPHLSSCQSNRRPSWFRFAAKAECCRRYRTGHSTSGARLCCLHSITSRECASANSPLTLGEQRRSQTRQACTALRFAAPPQCHGHGP